jgi:hypothetical protein
MPRKNPHERYEEFMEYLAHLKSVPCTDCEQRWPVEVMQFDHVNTANKLNISTMFSYSWDAINAELAKCEVVCANCHMFRTHKRGQFKKRKKNDLQLNNTHVL